MSSARHYVTLAGLHPATANSSSRTPDRALPSFQEFCEGVRALKHDDLLTNPNEQRQRASSDRAASSAGPAGMSCPTAINTSGRQANTAVQVEVAIASHIPAHQDLVGCVLRVTHKGVSSTAEALRHLRQSPEVPVQVRNFLNDPLPGFMRPFACSNIQCIPVQLYQYVEFLALNLASDDALLGIWVDMFNTMDIKISFAVMCAICERIINRARQSIKLTPGIALHDHGPLKEAMLQKLILKVIALHFWAISEDGIKVRQTQARVLADRFDPECSYNLAASIARWNGSFVNGSDQ